MSTRNHCRRCGCKANDCGCESPLITTSGEYCPGPPVCSEYMDSGCILYSGADIPLWNIKYGMPLNEVIGKFLLLVGSGGAACVLQDPAPDCEAIDLISIVSVTTTTITISWPLVSLATAYAVNWRLGSSGAFTASSSLSNTTSQYTITGLVSGSSYDIYVTTACSIGACDSLVIRLSTL